LPSLKQAELLKGRPDELPELEVVRRGLAEQ
jgi:hypothetical protein